MGLDITAYRSLSTVENPDLDGDGCPVADDQWKCRGTQYSERNWPGRTRGLEADAVYRFADSLGFRAGSYVGYNQWRNQLARLAGYESAVDCWNNHPDGPFRELIEFSDCEGVIGPVVAAKLSEDFAAFRTKAEESADAWFVGQYRLWQQAFEMAADNGAVDFH